MKISIEQVDNGYVVSQVSTSGDEFVWVFYTMKELKQYLDDIYYQGE